MTLMRVTGAYALAAFLLAAQGLAAEPRLLHEGSKAQQAKARAWNQSRFLETNQSWDVARPYSEMETTGFVAISGDDFEELAALREALARGLPAPVSLVIYVDAKSQVSAIKSKLSPLIGDRLKFLVVPSGNNEIWGRDSLPFPVWLKSGAMGLVDSIYPQDFEPDVRFVKAFSAATVKTNTYFRGGNVLMDEQSNCYSERAREVADMSDPETFFKSFFACKTSTVLERSTLGGIGDIDERLKFLPNKRVMTDDPAYETLLRGRGYEVLRVPTTGQTYETYMNTLYVNGTIFVPQMGLSTDKAALEAYRAVGMNPIGVKTKGLADNGHGNIHCTTMNFPPGAFVPDPSAPDFVSFKAP